MEHCARYAGVTQAHMPNLYRHRTDETAPGILRSEEQARELLMVEYYRQMQIERHEEEEISRLMEDAFGENGLIETQTLNQMLSHP